MKNFFDILAGLFRSDPNKIGEDGLTRLQRAVFDNDAAKVRSLVKAGADINARGELIFPPLHLALNKDRHDIAAFLIEKGADVNLKDMENKTPLHIAASQSQEYLVGLLLKAGADPMIRDGKECTPLHVLSTANPALVGMIVKGGCDPNAKNELGQTALHVFIHRFPMVEALLNNGASPILKNAQGRSAFQMMLENDTLVQDGNFVRLILQWGADVSEKNNNGETLLHRAARLDLPEIFNRIFDSSDLSATDDNGNNVLHALVRNRNLSLMEKVIEKAPELVNQTNARAKTPLARMMQRINETHYALVGHDRYEKAARMILDAGASPNTKDEDGATLLHYATITGRLSFLEDLISRRGIDLNAKDRKGTAALNIVVEKKNMEMLDRLLDAGADPDLTDQRGWTLLDRMAEKNDRDSPIVQRLIVAGGRYNKMLPLNPDQMRDKPQPGIKKPSAGGGPKL